MSQARPRLRVSDGVTRQSSSTKGRIDLPAAAGDGATVSLIVDGPSGHSHQQVGLGIAGDDACTGEVSEEPDDPEAVLKFLRADIHLIVAEIDAGVDFMLAADQVEIVLEGEDIRSALKWRVAAIAEGPIAAVGLQRKPDP